MADPSWRMRAARRAAMAVLGGGALLACKRDKSAAAAQCPTCVVADERGFTPASLTLGAAGNGETREVTFTRTSDETCARDIVFPELGIKEELPLHKPVALRVPVDSARTLTFQCGMGMYKSRVVVR